MNLPNIISGSDFDREFMLEHEAAYNEVVNRAMKIAEQMVRNKGSKLEANRAARQYISTHPLFHPLAALKRAGVEGIQE
jgi:hypothetical protein